MNEIKQAWRSFVRSHKSIPTQSTFEQDGKITPEEFVLAGDNLVFKCPTWRWEGGLEGKKLPYLPPDRQYLITTRVPCRKRANFQASTADEKIVKDDDGDDWVATGGDEHATEQVVDEIQDLKLAASPPSTTTTAPATLAENEEPNDSDDDDDDDDALEEIEVAPREKEDPSALTSLTAPHAALTSPKAPASIPTIPPNSNILSCRSYNVIITYDLYYQSPRVWLSGLQEDGVTALTQKQIFEDISEDHAKKTVTIDPHPHLGVPMATIHPCRHASVMKRFSERMADSGKVLRPDQYFFMFLKFLSAVVPTIELDFTMQVDGK